MHVFIVIIAISTFLAGCSTKGALSNYTAVVKAAAFPMTDDDETAKAALEKKKRLDALDVDFLAAQAVCKTSMDNMYDSFTGSGKREVTLAVIGIVAGSVIVPALAAKAAAAKSAIAGWGGIAGAANAAQFVLHEKGASAAAIAGTYQKVYSDIEKFENNYNKDAATEADKRTAVTDLNRVCTIRPIPTAVAPTAPTTTTTTTTTPQGASATVTTTK